MSTALIDSLKSLKQRIDARLLPPDEPANQAYASLAYLSFLAFPLLARWWGSLFTSDWILTVLSVLVFLPLYFASYWLTGWRRLGVVTATALLGVALLPSNPFANTYTIYACMMAATMPRRQLFAAFAIAHGSLLAALMQIDHVAMWFVSALSLGVSGIGVFAMRMAESNNAKQRALKLSQDEVRRLAQVAERERIGRDLHDLLGHSLSVIAIKAELAGKLAARDLGAARAEIADVERIARESLGQVRRAVSGMRAVGLRAEFANARLALGAVQVDFDYRADEVPMHPESESVLALALREAATNIIRHAQARRVHARLAREHDEVLLTISDDGRGGVAGDGNGLRGMRERVATVGGSIAVESPVGRGTTITIRIPWRAPPEPGRSEGGAALRLVG